MDEPKTPDTPEKPSPGREPSSRPEPAPPGAGPASHAGAAGASASTGAPGSGPPPGQAPPPPDSAGPPDRDACQWAMLCHLAALVGLLGNGIGFLLGPLVVWLLRRQDDPFIDDQGKEAVNFQLTMLLAIFVSIPLMLVLIGIPMLLTVFVIMTVLPVVGAIRASEGRPYRYPLSIRFIR